MQRPREVADAMEATIGYGNVEGTRGTHVPCAYLVFLTYRLVSFFFRYLSAFPARQSLLKNPWANLDLRMATKSSSDSRHLVEARRVLAYWTYTAKSLPTSHCSSLRRLPHCSSSGLLTNIQIFTIVTHAGHLLRHRIARSLSAQFRRPLHSPPPFPRSSLLSNELRVRLSLHAKVVGVRRVRARRSRVAVPLRHQLAVHLPPLSQRQSTNVSTNHAVSPHQGRAAGLAVAKRFSTNVTFHDVVFFRCTARS